MKTYISAGAHLSLVDLKEPISFFRSHRESSMLAIALEDFSMSIIDIDSRREVRKFIGHLAQLTDATFSPDSRWLSKYHKKVFLLAL